MKELRLAADPREDAWEDRVMIHGYRSEPGSHCGYVMRYRVGDKAYVQCWCGKRREEDPWLI